MITSFRRLGRALVILVALAILPTGPVASAQRPGPGARHRHPHAERLVLPGGLDSVRLVPAALPPATARERAVADGHRRTAFTVDRTRLFVVELRSGRAAEVVGIPFEWRPFSDVTWSEGRLVFDRWSSPHVGAHYLLDVATGRLVGAWSFHDEVAER
jgi:hypothetical protein